MTEVVTDKNVRTIQLRRIGVLEQLRLYKAMGPGLSINDMYMSVAMTAAAAAAIDDVPLPFPTNEAGLEAIVERLGSDGIQAIETLLVPNTLAQVVAEAGNC